MCTVCCVAGSTNIKAKVLKDGHLFVVHVLDPQLETSEEIASLPQTETELMSWADTASEQNSGKLSTVVFYIHLLFTALQR